MPLTGKTIALPETRELDLFASILSKRNATILRCPMLAIVDTDRADAVNAWIDQVIAGDLDDLILLTGEGLRRLLGFAERGGKRDAFIQAVKTIRTITRGPKPIKALRDAGLRSDLSASFPTSDGVIETLKTLDMTGRRVGVQLYGDEPNEKLITFIESIGGVPVPVAPYAYASASDDQAVIDLIQKMAAGEVDVIAFTSAQQVRRMRTVAAKNDRDGQLEQGFDRVKIAAVGPVVADELKERGLRVDMMPSKSFFLKPLVTEIIKSLGSGE